MKEPPLPPAISSDREYRRMLNNVEYWKPWARAALAASKLPQPSRLWAGRDTSYPTLICDTGMVVKLFGDRFAGPQSHQAEAEAYLLLAETSLPVPQLLASGQLYPDADGWRWPYLVLSTLLGEPWHALRGSLDRSDREHIARQIGAFLHRLHAVRLRGQRVLREDWGRFLTLLRRRRRDTVHDQLRWGHLSPHLCRKLDALLPEDPASLIDASQSPVFVHGDLFDEHIFVDPALRRLTGVIDFTDVYAGEPRYDLVALHFGTFGADKGLLTSCLEAYGWPPQDDRWAETMLAFTLLHDFDMLAGIPEYRSQLRKAEDPEALAQFLWDLGI
ncbi:MAG: phosphotransferase family protein [Candidatus Geothermarchaeales archaeon]